MTVRRALNLTLRVSLLTASLLLWDLRASAADVCSVQRVTAFPGSHEFGSDFLEAMVGDPQVRDVVWGLTADLSSKVPPAQRAMYISRSNDGGRTWAAVARVGPQYFNADIGEGERNGLAVAPGGKDFVITTQLGAFQVLARTGGEPVVKSIAGPRVPRPDPDIIIPKREGDPLTAGAVKMTADGKRLIVGFGYFDLQPQLRTYRRGKDGGWHPDKPLPAFPTDMDIFSMQFGEPHSPAAGYLYVGTGDQAFLLKNGTSKWVQLAGVGDDSAIQGISTVGGPHLAACWGIYQPLSAGAVERVTHASFLLHRNEDEAGDTIRAFSVDVDPARPNREIVTSLTGVYVSSDRGETWRRVNELPAGEFRAAHFNTGDGSVIVSGIFGTFVINPFLRSCSVRLKVR